MRPGDSNAITREYFDSLLLEMRHIDCVRADTETSFFGESFAMPIATAALSHLNNTCENGMARMAQGVYAAGALCFSGMGEKEELKAMCASGAKVIKIIKPHASNDTVYAKIREAEECGAFAVGMDIDHAFSANGEYDCVCGLDMKPKSLEELKGFIESTKLPFIIKGILSLSDAEKALSAGAAGLVVSHHHGIMDYAVPPLMLLPELAAFVAGRVPLFADCCFESGMDAFKALALGADGVCVGRAIMGPLAEAGAEGVRDKLRQINSELCGVMSRTGCASIKDIEPSIIHRRSF